MYLLYALTRIRSIARNAGKSPEELLESARATPIALEHEAELKLATVLLRFAEVRHPLGWCDNFKYILQKNLHMFYVGTQFFIETNEII